MPTYTSSVVVYSENNESRVQIADLMCVCVYSTSYEVCNALKQVHNN